MKTIDYYYSTRSNFTYLGAGRLNALAREHGHFGPQDHECFVAAVA